MADAFLLAYGLHWSFDDVCRLTIRHRGIFVDALERQWAAEREQVKGR